MQTEEFLGRKLAKHLKVVKGKGESRADLASASAAEDEDEEGEEVLGRQRRKEGAESLDLEVVDDRDLYQHLLKVRVLLSSVTGTGDVFEGCAGGGLDPGGVADAAGCSIVHSHSSSSRVCF